MSEFWEQQLMDRILALAFDYRKAEKEQLPKKQVNDIMNYVKFVIQEKIEEEKEKVR